MKFTIQSADLLKAMGPIVKIVPSNHNIDIIANVLIVSKNGNITITGTDMQSTIITTIPCIEGNEGEIAINAKKFFDLLKTMPSTVLTIETKDETVSISWETGTSTLPDMGAKEYPAVKECTGTTFAIHAADLTDALNKTSGVTELHDELRTIMSGIHFDYKNDNINIVGASKQMLMITNYNINNQNNEGSFTIIPKPTNTLRALTEKTEKDIIVTTDDKKAQFTIDNTILQIQLLEGKYPAYLSVIPTSSTTKIIINRELLISTLSRTSICSDEDKNLVTLDIKDSTINMSARDLTKGTKSHETISCSQMIGEDVNVNFNADSLCLLLSRFTDEEITFNLNGSDRAATIENFDQKNTMKAIILPMRIS